MEVPKSTPIESFFLELGAIPMGVIIKARRVNYLYSILSRDKSGMLYSFFITQWNSPSKGDWTEIVKKDLEDFSIPCSFEYIRSKSKDAFKKLVKVKAREFALRKLRKKQESHSKMEKLEYKEIKIQNYLTREDINTKQKKIVFKYRTRMATFGENYRGGRSQVICPLCELHLDNQEMSYECPIVRSEITINGNISDIYREDMKLETVETITKISELRKLKMED